MLNTVVRSGHLSLPFLEISRKVNENWSEQNIQQKSKVDYVEIGDNWKNFYWPSRYQILTSKSYLLFSIIISILHISDASRIPSFDENQDLLHRDRDSDRRRRSMTYVALTSAKGNQRRSQNNFKKHFYLDTLKFILPKSLHQSGLKTDHDVQNVSRFFSTVKEYITKLETTCYKTAMMLFYDLMK